MSERVEGRPIGIGLVGAGTVGIEVIRTIQQIGPDRGYVVKGVAVRDPHKDRGINAPFTKDVKDILEDPSIDIFVEVAGGIEPARSWMADAMARGMSVVSANKAAIAGSSLINEATERQVDFAFEASVGGGIPIIRPLITRSFVDDVIRIRGIVNGTTNYALTQMAKGEDFDSVIAEAQRKGFAEANYESDTQGYDSRYKLAILASLAFKKLIDPESISRVGITGITPVDLEFARQYQTDEGGPGYSVKLLAIATRQDDGSLVLEVTPALISKDQLLALVNDEFNGIEVDWKNAGPQLTYGRGAGGVATASAVNEDIDRVVRNKRLGIVDELPRLDSGLYIAQRGSDTQRSVNIPRPDGTSIRLPVEG
ncbi:MAG: homoserine dehydrogenase [Candidatus Levybacteria bacterium]|nr:homoserine dehydrogenase [Candidatus Levybacteria bacterium]MBI2421100.1 homoserine dehydrogenase [Candidatus Levybacteria bacterium]